VEQERIKLWFRADSICPVTGGDIVATTFDTFGDGPISENKPVAAVAPADLKSVWAMQDDVQARYPGQQVSISADLWKSACSPGADVRAVFLRVSMLRMLQMLSGSGTLISPWLHDGKPDDAVFKAFATVPMLGLQVGTPRQGFPFDVEELIKLIKKESEGE
jgi:hypothetical protein